MRARGSWSQVRPTITAILMGAVAGLIALLTYQAMMALQHLIWTTGAPDGDVGVVRIIVTISCGGALLILLSRISPSESMDDLLRDSDNPRGRSQKKILTTALVAIVSIAFGGAIGPEAGLLAVVAECSIIVSRFIARDEAHARAIAHAGNAGVLGGLYGSPPAAAALDDDAPAPTRLLSFIAGLAGFATFIFVARTVFGGEGVASIPLPASSAGNEWLLIVPALVGAALGVLFRIAHAGLERVTAKVMRPWVLTAIGTALFAVLAAFLPLVRFSGHHELGEVTALFAGGDAAALWLIAVAKVIALVLCLVAGWRGGEVFPLIFIGAAGGAAAAISVPGVDPAAAMAAAMAATLAVGWRRPLAGVFVLILVIDIQVAIPLLIGTGIGILVDRLVFPASDLTESQESADSAST